MDMLPVFIFIVMLVIIYAQVAGWRHVAAVLLAFSVLMLSARVLALYFDMTLSTAMFVAYLAGTYEQRFVVALTRAFGGEK